MLQCPVCKSSYKQEVKVCQRCNLLENDICHINEISSNNPILTTCIPKLLKKINQYKEKYIEIKYKNEQLLNLQQLSINIQTIQTEQKQDQQKLEKLEKIVIQLQSQIQNKDNHYNINLDTQENYRSSIYPQSSTLIGHTPIHSNSEDVGNVELINRNNMVSTQNDLQDNNLSDLEDSNNSVFFKQTDFQINNDSNELLDPQESNLNNEIGQDKFFQVIDTQVPQFVETYNIDKNLFDEYATYTVTETKDSRDNRLAGRSETVFLSSISKGNYWIVEENNNSYLVPHAKISINEHNKRYTIENIFECNESSSGDYNFLLIQPAKVSKIDSGLWKLEKKGKLEFS